MADESEQGRFLGTFLFSDFPVSKYISLHDPILFVINSPAAVQEF